MQVKVIWYICQKTTYIKNKCFKVLFRLWLHQSDKKSHVSIVLQLSLQ